MLAEKVTLLVYISNNLLFFINFAQRGSYYFKAGNAEAESMNF